MKADEEPKHRRSPSRLSRAPGGKDDDQGAEPGQSGTALVAKEAEEEAKQPAEKPSPQELARREVITGLCKFLKYNTNLQHLNLTNTGLDHEIIYALANEALTKARSLVCLHLCDNPGITADNIEFIKYRVKA